METAEPSGLRNNPVFWIMWLLPLSTVLAGLATLAIALRSGDRALPAAYHWEGAAVDQDFARARVAAAHGIEIRLAMQGGVCTAFVTRAPGDAQALDLALTDAIDPSRDRATRLERVALGEYSAPCARLPDGKWRIAVDDDARTWSVRARIDGALDGATMQARDPHGGGS